MSDPNVPDPVPPAADYATPGTPGGGGLFAKPISPTELVTDPVARQWGLFGHLSALIGFVFPFGNVLGPLIIWQMKKDEIPFAGDQAKEALNFHITLSIYLIISLALMCVVIGFFLAPLVGLYGLIMSILGGVAANKGEYYRYPFTIRLIK